MKKEKLLLNILSLLYRKIFESEKDILKLGS
jgi:hypothetical protein